MTLTSYDLESQSQPPTDTRVAPGKPMRWTWLVASLALAGSLAGLLVDGVYTGAASTAAMFRGYDLVTAVVVVPALIFTSRLVRRGWLGADMITASLVGYLLYTYAYYLFGTGFNDLFLLHAAVFCAGLFALILTLGRIDAASVKRAFDVRTRTRIIAGILGVLAIALGAMWIYFAIDNAATGEVPAGSQLVETDAIVKLGMTLDLTLLVPLYAVAAVLLWRRAAWGYLLAAIALPAGILHQVSYLVAMPFQTAAGVPGAVSYDPAEPVILLLYLVAAALLLHGTRQRCATR